MGAGNLWLAKAIQGNKELLGVSPQARRAGEGGGELVTEDAV